VAAASGSVTLSCEWSTHEQAESQDRDEHNPNGSHPPSLSGVPRPGHPLHAQPGGWLQVSVFGMQVSPHAFPVVQTLQHEDPVESLLQAAVRGGPLAATSVSASATATRTFFQIPSVTVAAERHAVKRRDIQGAR